MESLNIIVVEDSTMTTRKIKQMLQEIGHTVIATARTGIEAIEAAKKYKADIITMDITMPDMDGIEATKRILSMNPETRIIIITSHGQELMVYNAVEAGAKGYLLKPLERDKLKTVISEVYEKYGGRNKK